MGKESRELGIDCFKGILILLMVFAHYFLFLINGGTILLKRTFRN